MSMQPLLHNAEKAHIAPFCYTFWVRRRVIMLPWTAERPELSYLYSGDNRRENNRVSYGVLRQPQLVDQQPGLRLSIFADLRSRSSRSERCYITAMLHLPGEEFKPDRPTRGCGMARRFALLAAVALLMACEGTEGPTGPTGLSGSQGPQGPAGPGTQLVYDGVTFAGGGTLQPLPIAVGSINNPPVITCYVTEDNLYWFILAQDGTNGGWSCGIEASGAGIDVVILGVPAGWAYRIVVIY